MCRSYPGSSTDVPSIMVFRPTWEEFKDFNKYLVHIESKGLFVTSLVSGIVEISVADPGCLSRIPDQSFFHPGSGSATLVEIEQELAESCFLFPYVLIPVTCHSAGIIHRVRYHLIQYLYIKVYSKALYISKFIFLYLQKWLDLANLRQNVASYNVCVTKRNCY